MCEYSQPAILLKIWVENHTDLLNNEFTLERYHQLLPKNIPRMPGCGIIAKPASETQRFHRVNKFASLSERLG